MYSSRDMKQAVADALTAAAMVIEMERSARAASCTWVMTGRDALIKNLARRLAYVQELGGCPLYACALGLASCADHGGDHGRV